MVQAENLQVSVVRQCSLLKISRSGLYYQPAGESTLNLSLMSEIDRVFLEYPFFGSRQLRDYLNNTLGYCVGRKRVCRLMNRMGLAPVYQEPRTTVQGSQFTSAAFTGLLQEHGIQISMDGRGRCLDNVFIERLWRSLTYEDVYLNNYGAGAKARVGIGKWIRFYNMRRPHSSLGGIPPDRFYSGQLANAA